MSRLVARCPHCSGKLSLKDESYLGRKVRCPRCEEPFVIKGDASSASGGARPPVAKKRQPKKTRPRPAPAASGADDWLDGVDSFDDDASFDDAPRSAPPAVIGQKRKKKKRPPQNQSKIDSLRDEDGDLPLALHWMMMVGTGLVGGAIGSVIWGVIIYYTEYEVGYVAILVGVLAGTGVRVGASEWDYGWGPALTAVGVAIFSIIVGKTLAVYFVLGSVIGGSVILTLLAVAISSFLTPADAIFNLLWMGLACSSAFKIAAGWDDDD